MSEEKKNINIFNNLFQDKKKTTWMLGALILGIVLMTFGSFTKKEVETPQSQETAKEEVVTTDKTNTISQAEIILEKKLENILNKMEGTGETTVTVFLEEGPEYEYAVNVSSTEKKTSESDQSGGTRTITEYNEDGNIVLLRSGTSGESPVVVKEIKPKVKGVLVVSPGASNPIVKEKITIAVTTLLDIPTSKVSVMEGR